MQWALMWTYTPWYQVDKQCTAQHTCPSLSSVTASCWPDCLKLILETGSGVTCVYTLTPKHREKGQGGGTYTRHFFLKNMGAGNIDSGFPGYFLQELECFAINYKKQQKLFFDSTEKNPLKINLGSPRHMCREAKLKENGRNHPCSLLTWPPE